MKKNKSVPGENSRRYNGGRVIQTTDEQPAAQGALTSTPLDTRKREWRHLDSRLWRRGNRHLVSAN